MEIAFGASVLVAASSWSAFGVGVLLGALLGVLRGVLLGLRLGARGERGGGEHGRAGAPGGKQKHELERQRGAEEHRRGEQLKNIGLERHRRGEHQRGEHERPDVVFLTECGDKVHCSRTCPGLNAARHVRELKGCIFCW